MTQLPLTSTAIDIDTVSEATPRPKWPDYEACFVAIRGDNGPSKTECREALKRDGPELISFDEQLVVLAGESDRAARFVST